MSITYQRSPTDRPAPAVPVVHRLRFFFFFGFDLDIRCKYGKILSPTDGSDPSMAAVEQGVELAEAFDATVHFLYVVDVSLCLGVLLRSDLPHVDSQAPAAIRMTANDIGFDVGHQ